MTENGDPLENAVAELINGILKTEWLYDNKVSSWAETVSFIGRIINLYNNQRPNQSIGYMTPAFVHQTGMKTERKWKNYYHGKIISQENNLLESGNDDSNESIPAKKQTEKSNHIKTN